MRATLSLIRREFAAYFLSPIAYVVLFGFLAVTGYLFYLTTNLLTESGPRGIEFPMQGLLGDERFWLIFLFIPPLLTMRLFAEERASGTLEVLMTAPVRDWQVVFGKSAACFGFFVFMWLPTVVYLPVLLDIHATWNLDAWSAYGVTFAAGLGLAALLLLMWPLVPLGWAGCLLFLVALAAVAAGAWGHYTQDESQLVYLRYGIDPYPAVSSYLGVALAGAMFLSLGLFVSSLVKSQLVAAVASLALSLPFVVAAFWRPEMDTGSLQYQVLYYVSVPLHFEQEFTRGLIDSRRVVLYVSVTLLFFFLTVMSLNRRRWK